MISLKNMTCISINSFYVFKLRQKHDDFFKKHDLHINVISTAGETKVIQLVKNKMLKLCAEQRSEAVNKVGAWR